MPGSQMHPHTSSFHIGLLPLQHGSVFFQTPRGLDDVLTALALHVSLPWVSFCRFSFHPSVPSLQTHFHLHPHLLGVVRDQVHPSRTVLLHHPRLLAGASDSLAASPGSSFAHSPRWEAAHARVHVVHHPPVLERIGLPRSLIRSSSFARSHIGRRSRSQLRHHIPRPLGCALVVACSRR